MLLAPALVNMSNELMQGRSPPASFLEGLIMPLRKKRYSKDAMDYRPVALLQTGYKVIVKVISHRVQQVIGVPIQDTQKDCPRKINVEDGHDGAFEFCDVRTGAGEN